MNYDESGLDYVQDSTEYPDPDDVCEDCGEQSDISPCLGCEEDDGESDCLEHDFGGDGTDPECRDCGAENEGVEE